MLHSLIKCCTVSCTWQLSHVGDDWRVRRNWWENTAWPKRRWFVVFPETRCADCAYCFGPVRYIVFHFMYWKREFGLPMSHSCINNVVCDDDARSGPERTQLQFWCLISIDVKGNDKSGWWEHPRMSRISFEFSGDKFWNLWKAGIW